MSMLSRLKYDLTMAEAARSPGGSRVDLLVVADMVQHGARVLDVGCGDGELLRLLETRGVDGRGIELSREGVNECVAKGHAVIQGDAEHPFLQHQGFPRIVPRRRRQAGAGGGAQRLGRAHASENAVVVLEYVRRAGGILVEPTELGLTAKRARHWRWGVSSDA